MQPRNKVHYTLYRDRYSLDEEPTMDICIFASRCHKLKYQGRSSTSVSNHSKNEEIHKKHNFLFIGTVYVQDINTF